MLHLLQALLLEENGWTHNLDILFGRVWQGEKPVESILRQKNRLFLRAGFFM